MNYSWLNKQNNSNLILFFNGWGMSPAIVEHMNCGSYDVLEFHDYTSPHLDFDLKEIVSSYDSVSLIAWSLGVWAAAELLSDSDISIKHAVAVNGTLEPISDEYGLSPDIFQGTIDNWSEKSQFAFNRRMCRDKKEMELVLANQSARSIESQKEELIALKQRIENNNDISVFLPFNIALVSIYDKIFLPERQQNYWDRNAVDSQLFPAVHYLFLNFSDWSHILGI